MLLSRVGLAVSLAVAALGQTNDLAERLQQALTRSGDAELAAQLLAKRDFKPLEGLLARRASLDASGQTELVSLEGAVAFLAGDVKAAVRFFDNAGKSATLRDGDAFTLAMALVALRDDQRASVELSKLADKHPRQSLYVYWLGRIDYDLRRYPEAVQKLQKAVELDPKSARAWDSLGLAVDMQGQMDQAGEAFKKAAKFNRNLLHPSPWPPHDLGYWHLRMNQPKEAEAALRESLRYGPDFAQAHYHLARALEKEAREEEALSEYRAAIAGDTVSAEACYSAAMLYRKLHKDAEADAMFAEYRKRKEAQSTTPIHPLRD